MEFPFVVIRGVCIPKLAIELLTVLCGYERFVLHVQAVSIKVRMIEKHFAERV